MIQHPEAQEIKDEGFRALLDHRFFQGLQFSDVGLTVWPILILKCQGTSTQAIQEDRVK
jgi:hypothetical protein